MTFKVPNRTFMRSADRPEIAFKADCDVIRYVEFGVISEKKKSVAIFG